MKNTLAIALLLLATVPSCNKHDVALGGACEKGEDCDKNSLTCLIASGQTKGYCTKTCSIAPPGTTVTTDGQTCEQGGMVCEKASASHAILGDAYCVKK